MAFEFAEAFIDFVSRGANAVLGEISKIEAGLAGLSAQPATVDLGLTNLKDLEIAVDMTKLVPAQLVEGAGKATSAMTAMASRVGALAGSMTGLGGIGVMAFQSINKAIASTVAALGIGTGGLFFIVAAIGAAVVAIGAAFKSAFETDEEAQQMWATIKELVGQVLAIVGGPLVAAFKALAGPIVQLLDGLDRALDTIASLSGGLLDAADSARVLATVLTAGMAQGLSAVTALLEQLGLVRSLDEILKDSKIAGGKATFTSFEQFGKQVQGQLADKTADDIRRIRVATEKTAAVPPAVKPLGGLALPMVMS